MASDDWNEAKYTESAWACIVALTKAADYYANNTVDSPMLLDVLLNPTKHSAGDDADSAKRTVEKVLLKAGLDVSKLRQDLEIHMSKQPKLSGSGDQQKVMGRNMIKLLEFARDTKQILGDSFVSSEGLILALGKVDDLFTIDALRKQGKSYNDLLVAVQSIREKSGPAISRSAENMYDALNKYGVDFTEQAE